jgi:hypothetical protein
MLDGALDEQSATAARDSILAIARVGEQGEIIQTDQTS